MVIDFHTHIYPDAIAARTVSALEAKAGGKAFTDGTTKGLLTSMENAGVDVSVVLPVATKPQQFDTINAFAKQLNDEYGDRIISFGGIHPDCEDYKAKLDYIKSLGLKGIKIHPDYQGVMIDDIRYMNIIDYASEIDLIVITHAGLDIGMPELVHCPPDRMRKVLDTIKPRKMVLAHYGGWQRWEEVYEYIAGQDVYIDTAFTFPFIKEDMFMKILEKHGSDKILFASDSPWSSAKSDVEALRNMPISEDVCDAICSGNAKKLLNL